MPDANPAELNLRVLKTIRVNAPIQRAFEVFTQQMESWWPASHHIGTIPFVAIFIEPRVGGRWFEQNAEGSHCDWGTVLAWDPPHRVRLSWHVGPGHNSPDWVADQTLDLNRASEVEVRFHAEGPSTTLIELEHSKIERHGQGAAQLRELFDSPGAWSFILASLAAKIDGASAPVMPPAP